MQRVQSVLLSIVLGSAASAQDDPYCFDRLDFLGGGPAITAADFNGDGLLDIASIDGTISWNVGFGWFAPAVPVAPPMDGENIASGDIDGDGDIDIVSMRRILLNLDGQGLFGITEPSKHFGDLILLRDLTGDGAPDILGSPGLTLFVNDGSGQFPPEDEIAIPSGVADWAFSVADFDDDGDDDIFSLGSTPNGQGSFNVAFNEGDGVFSSVTTGWAFELPTSPDWRSHRSQPLDFDGDGLLDIVVAVNDSGRRRVVLVYCGNGDGTFCLSPIELVVFVSGINPPATGLATGDFNVDGGEDLAVASGSIQLWLSTPGDRVSVSGPDGPGGPGGGHLRGIAQGEFTGDGVPDVVGAYDGQLLRLENHFPCPADLNGDCSVDFTDVTSFLTGFDVSDPIADVAPPFGQLDFSDVVVFLSAFGAGCP